MQPTNSRNAVERALRQLSRPRAEVVGKGATGTQALEQVRALNPDVVVMDIRMPEMDGLPATRRITTDPAPNRTRVFGADDIELDEYVFGALDAAATGVLLKSGEPADLIHAIRVVAAGEALLAPSVTRRLIDTYVATAQPTAHTDHDTLDEPTNREREALGLVATGLTNAEIAQQLHLSPLTAKTQASVATTARTQGSTSERLEGSDGDPRPLTT